MLSVFYEVYLTGLPVGLFAASLVLWGAAIFRHTPIADFALVLFLTAALDFLDLLRAWIFGGASFAVHLGVALGLACGVASLCIQIWIVERADAPATAP